MDVFPLPRVNDTLDMLLIKFCLYACCQCKACKAYKFTRPFYGLYHIVGQSEAKVVVRPVNRPQADPFRVAYNRI